MSYPSDYATLQTAVIEKARLDAVLDLSKVKDWLNQAYFRVATEVEFWSTEAVLTPALVAGQTNCLVPTNLQGVDYIVPRGSDGSSWGPMEEVGFQELLEKRAWQGGTVPMGAPSRYSFQGGSANTSAFGNMIEFWPQAAGGEVFMFYGTALPAPLVNDSDLPMFPEPYASKCLEYGALCDATEFKKDIFMLNQYQQEFNDWTMRFRSFVNSRRGDRVMAMPVDRQRPYPRGNSVDTGVF